MGSVWGVGAGLGWMVGTVSSKGWSKHGQRAALLALHGVLMAVNQTP